MIESPSRETLEAAYNNDGISSLINEYLKFKKEVREGALGKTAKFWMSYIDHVWLILDVVRAVKHNDYALYSQSLFKITELFSLFDTIFLANVSTSHPGSQALLERGVFSVARSFTPGNRCPVDKTIEETFMHHSKSHGDLVVQE